MPKATLILRDGTQTVVDGTPEEVAAVMNLYSEKGGMTDLSEYSGGTTQAVSGQIASSLSFQVVVLLIYSVISLVILGVAGYMVMKSINDTRAELYSDQLLPVVQLWRARIALSQMRGDFDRFILVQELRDDSARAIAEDMAEVNERMDKYRKIFRKAIKQKALAEFHSAWVEYQQIVTGSMNRIKAGKKQSVRHNGSGTGFRAEVALKSMILMHENHAGSLNHEADVGFTVGIRMILVMVVIEVMAGCGLGMWLLRWRRKSA